MTSPHRQLLNDLQALSRQAVAAVRDGDASRSNQVMDERRGVLGRLALELQRLDRSTQQTVRARVAEDFEETARLLRGVQSGVAREMRAGRERAAALVGYRVGAPKARSLDRDG